MTTDVPKSDTRKMAAVKKRRLKKALQMPSHPSARPLSIVAQILLIILWRIELSSSQFNNTNGNNTSNSTPSLSTPLEPSVVSTSPPWAATKAPSLRPAASPTVYQDASPVPSTNPSLRPSRAPTESPTVSNAPSTVPSFSIAPSTSPSGVPSLAPSDMPSIVPTASLAPSNAPTISPVPTLSPAPSSLPSLQPSDVPSPGPTLQPSAVPTISLVPSSVPSLQPSSVPTVSLMPSSMPSVSMMPTLSIMPSSVPSGAPTGSPKPTNVASAAPSLKPSPVPSSVPSVAPTFPPLEVLPSSYMKMTLYGMEQNVSVFLDKFRNATSRHVENYWRGFGDVGPIYINNVRTRNVVETRIPSTVNRLLQVANFTGPYPDPLEITYSQSARWALKDNASAPQLHGFKTTDLFTLPFEQDGRSYTQTLRSLSGNSRIIVLEFEGLIDPPTTKKPDSDRQRTILAIVVSVVMVSVLLASAYILYLTRFKEDNSPDTGTPPTTAPFAEIGVTPDQNTLMSASFEDEGFLLAGPSNDEVVMTPGLALPPSPPRGPDGVLQTTPSVEPDDPSGITIEDHGGGSSDDALPPTRRSSYSGTGSIHSAVGGGVETQQIPPGGPLGSIRTISTAPMTASDVGSSEYNSQQQQQPGVSGHPYGIGNLSPLPSFRSNSTFDDSPMAEDAHGQFGYPQAGEYVDGDEDSESDPNVPYATGFEMKIQDLE